MHWCLIHTRWWLCQCTAIACIFSSYGISQCIHAFLSSSVVNAEITQWSVISVEWHEFGLKVATWDPASYPYPLIGVMRYCISPKLDTERVFGCLLCSVGQWLMLCQMTLIDECHLTDDAQASSIASLSQNHLEVLGDFGPLSHSHCKRWPVIMVALSIISFNYGRKPPISSYFLSKWGSDNEI